MGHSGGEIFENIVNSNSHPPDAGFTTALPRFDGDDILVVH
jgi:hypothetical protein